MPHHPLPKRLVIATHNNGKLQEFNALLGPYIGDIVSAGALDLPSPEETGTTFAENAFLKAQAAMKASALPALADDSGLCVNALAGKPGIYSARLAGDNKNFSLAMQSILDDLSVATDRSAYFICVLTLCWPDGYCVSVEGRVDGIIASAPYGNNGHGYDPIFIPTGHKRTFAEMEDAEKNTMSHRHRAIQLLIGHITSDTISPLMIG